MPELAPEFLSRGPKEIVAMRLDTMHNVRYFVQPMSQARKDLEDRRSLVFARQNLDGRGACR